LPSAHDGAVHFRPLDQTGDAIDHGVGAGL
jgi:hypothetical protein